MSEWRGELRLALLNEARIEFHVNPEESIIDLVPNRRYMCHFEEIPDQENDVTEDRRPVLRGGKVTSQVALGLCGDAVFQRWVVEALRASGRGTLPQTMETALFHIKTLCSIRSLEMLESDPVALKIFTERIEMPFYRYINQK